MGSGGEGRVNMWCVSVIELMKEGREGGNGRCSLPSFHSLCTVYFLTN